MCLDRKCGVSQGRAGTSVSATIRVPASELLVVSSSERKLTTLGLLGFIFLYEGTILNLLRLSQPVHSENGSLSPQISEKRRNSLSCSAIFHRKCFKVTRDSPAEFGTPLTTTLEPLGQLFRPTFYVLQRKLHKKSFSWMHAVRSCADRCFDNMDPGEPCQCNDNCLDFGDCCPDFEDLCLGKRVTRPSRSMCMT